MEGEGREREVRRRGEGRGDDGEQNGMGGDGTG